MARSQSSRSPLMAALRRCIRASARHEKTRKSGWAARGPALYGGAGIPGPPDAERGGFDLGRRDFLKTAALLGAGALLPGCRKVDKAASAPPRVAIVGAGLAGLSAAHHLRKGGIEADLFEAGPRAGGRILTLRDAVGPGLYTEAGGEFIDSTHADMLSLAREFGLRLSDMQGEAYAAFRADAWHFGGRLRSEAEVTAAVRAVAQALQADMESLPEEIHAGVQGSAADLDALSLEEYLEKRGVSGWFGDLLKVAYVTEFGLEAGEQSCLNLLTLLSLDLSDGFAVYGESDERYRVEGGNQGVPDALARTLDARIRLGHRLEALSQKAGGGYRLFFQGPAGALEHQADLVLLTVPFPVLRQVDLRLEIPPLKRRAIAELGMGQNAKLFLGYSARAWRKNGHVGNFFTDRKPQSGWDSTQTQAGEAGGLTVFQGGRAGMDLGRGGPQGHAEAMAADLEALYPGSRKSRNDKAGVYFWPGHPLALGSYACYRPGQWTGLGGEEGKPVGNLYFAGEHCSADFQGYMNGAAETGRRAAEAILGRFGYRS